MSTDRSLINNIQKSLHAIRLIGLANVVRSVRYALYRDRLDARYLPTKTSEASQSPGELIASAAIPSGAEFRFATGALTVQFLKADFLYVAWDGAQMAPSYAVVKTDWGEVDTRLERAEEGWRVRSEALELHVSTDGTLQLRDAAGQFVRHEEPPRRFGRGWQQGSPLAPEACIYGLGERAANLNLRPGSYRFWNVDAGGTYAPGADPLYICMPVYLCLQGGGSYLIFYDNSYDGRISLGGSADVCFEGGPLRYYLAVAPPTVLLERFTLLTGRAPLPPRWALGYQQSRWGYRTEAEMRRVFAGFQRYNLPLSVLYLDIDHLDGYRTLTVNQQRYPNLPGFAQVLEEAGVHLVAITNPGVKREANYDLYQDGCAQDAFCKDPQGYPVAGVVWPGWAELPDFTNPRARHWWGAQYSRHLKYGMAGFWHDMNEPVSFAGWGEATLPLSTQHDMEGSGGDHRAAHNLYGLLMNRAGYEGLRKLQPHKRPFILSRAGWVGMQRYSWAWTGDVETSWAALRQTIASVLGLALSGQPYAGADIGGFSGQPSPELFVRWFQLGSFLPFFRTHCALYLPRREPWEFGEQVLEILREQLQLRYRLLPYWYTLAWIASQSGHLLARPLFWTEPQDQALWEVGDAYLLGNALLIAPVVEEGARRRFIYPPKGGWYDFWSDRFIEGHTQIELDAPLSRLPILVRAGSILPTTENERLVLHIYHPSQGEDGENLLYSDQGDGYGPHRLDKLKLSPISAGGFELTWTSEGELAWPYAGVVLHLHGFTAEEILLERQKVPLHQGRVETGQFARLCIPV